MLDVVASGSGCEDEDLSSALASSSILEIDVDEEAVGPLESS
jgi:hypothetical protein